MFWFRKVQFIDWHGLKYKYNGVVYVFHSERLDSRGGGFHMALFVDKIYVGDKKEGKLVDEAQKEEIINSLLDYMERRMKMKVDVVWPTK